MNKAIYIKVVTITLQRSMILFIEILSRLSQDFELSFLMDVLSRFVFMSSGLRSMVLEHGHNTLPSLISD